MDLRELLKIAVERKASDLHIKVGSPPVIRIDNRLIPLTEKPRVSQEDALRMVSSVMNEEQRETFKEKHEIDLAYSVQGLGRFRANVFQQRSTIGMVMRVIPMKIDSIEELNLPPGGGKARHGGPRIDLGYRRHGDRENEHIGDHGRAYERAPDGTYYHHRGPH